ncbi:MAG: MopE-related protein [Myxococcota bacterium]
MARQKLLVAAAVLSFASCQCGERSVLTRCEPEVCDGADNDCDGQIDEDLPDLRCGVGACERVVASCTGGRPTACTPAAPTAEVCNGIDDDCNGVVDDGLGVERCGVGSCVREVSRCADGQPQVCAPGAPSPEVCNGQDDDCDGEIDEGLLGVSCGVGACHRVVDLCGDVSACVPGEPSQEVCNGIDDDCDGEIDEGRCMPPVVACPGPFAVHVGDALALSGQILQSIAPISESWSVEVHPAGSIAMLDGTDRIDTSFTPDVPGEYQLSFCVTDGDALKSCCTTVIHATECATPPAPPAGTACGTSWDGRPIVSFDPVAPGLRYDLVGAGGSTLATAAAGTNWMRPATRIASGGPMPGAAVELGVRACRSNDNTCCSPLTPLTVQVVEDCAAPIAPTRDNVVLSEYVINGEGSCNPPDCFVCQAGESIEITNLSNCPVSLDGTHFKYRNAAASSGSLRWMNFGPSDVIPPRGVYVAIRGRAFAPACAASLPAESPGLYGLKISTLAMQGNNICSGWFNNTGGGMSEMQLATGTVMSEADLMFSATDYLARIAPYQGGTAACVSIGFDALDSCGSVAGGQTPSAELNPNQLGRLWHPCDAVVGAVPACVRD